MSAPFAKLPCDSFGPRAHRLLLPIDLAKCPPEIFPLANGFTQPLGGEIILLYVLTRLTPKTQVVGSDAELRGVKRQLARVGRYYLRPTVEGVCRVRVGTPHREILAEAADSGVDLILLPVFAPSIWRRLVGANPGETARNLTAEASCRVFVVDVRARFNCMRRWAGQEHLGLWAA